MEHLVVRDELLRLRSDLAAIAARIDELVLAFDCNGNDVTVAPSGAADVNLNSGFGHLDLCADVIAFDTDANAEPPAVGDAPVAAEADDNVLKDEPAPAIDAVLEPVAVIEWQYAHAVADSDIAHAEIDDVPAVEEATTVTMAADDAVEAVIESTVELVSAPEAIDENVVVAELAEDAAVVEMAAEDLTVGDNAADLVALEDADVVLEAAAEPVIEIVAATESVEDDLVVAELIEVETVTTVAANAAVVAETKDEVVAEHEAAPVAVTEVTKIVATDDTSVTAMDDLGLIAGIDQSAKDVLSAASITTYEQIVELSPAAVAEINEKLSSKGRVSRECWIEQAALLAAGNTTKHADAVKDGTVAAIVAAEPVEPEVTAVAEMATATLASEPVVAEASPTVTALVPVTQPAGDNVVALVPAAQRLRSQKASMPSVRRSGRWTRSIAAALAVAAIGFGAYGASNQDFSRSARERLCQVDMLRDTKACGLVRASMVMFNR